MLFPTMRIWVWGRSSIAPLLSRVRTLTAEGCAAFHLKRCDKFRVGPIGILRLDRIVDIQKFFLGIIAEKIKWRPVISRCLEKGSTEMIVINRGNGNLLFFHRAHFFLANLLPVYRKNLKIQFQTIPKFLVRACAEVSTGTLSIGRVQVGTRLSSLQEVSRMENSILTIRRT